MSWICCLSVSLFSVPAGRFEKALSVGANTVIPSVEVLTWLLIWSEISLSVRKRMKVVNWLPSSRMAVMLMGPAGAGPGAEGVTAWERERRRRRVRVERERVWDAILVEVVEVHGEGMGFLWDKS